MYEDASAPLPKDPWSCARRDNYKKLSDEGYDQLPCGSNHAAKYNFDHQARFSKENIAPEHLKGLLVAPWCDTTELDKYIHFSAIVYAKKAIDDHWKD
jgi:hypothetical protein